MDLTVCGHVLQDREHVVGELLRVAGTGAQDDALREGAVEVSEQRPRAAVALLEVLALALVTRWLLLHGARSCAGSGYPSRGVPQVVVELVGELRVECGGGGDADQDGDQHHQRDDGEDQPRGERGEVMAHRLSPRA